MDNTLIEYKEMLRTIKSLEDKVRVSIQHRIKDCKPLEGVTSLSNNCFTVKASTISRSKGHILSPCYYSPKVQVREVMTYLFKKSEETTLTTVIKKINELVDKGYVVNKGNKTLLNDNMIQVLKGVITDLSD